MTHVVEMPNRAAAVQFLQNPWGLIDAGTRGTYYFDAFESRRQTYIGPVSSLTPTPTNTAS